MYCTACGAANSDSDRACTACGKPLIATNPYQSGIASADAPFGRVPNYLVQSVLATLCCCLPFGVVAIVYAAQVDGKLAARDYSGAARASDSAKMWCWISFGCGAAATGLYLALMSISAFMRER